MAKRKRRQKIDKELARELKQPDEFVTGVMQLQEWANEHRAAVVGVLVAIFAVVAVANGVAAYARSRAERRHTEEYHTLKAATETLFQAKDKAKAMEQVEGLIRDASDRTDRARLYLTQGEMLLEAGDPAGAVKAFEGALATAREPLLKNLAAFGLAAAELAQGKDEQAAKRLAGVEGPLADLARVEQIRIALAHDNAGEARELFNQLEGSTPDSPAVATARQLLEGHGIHLEKASPEAEAAG
ncbi:MAG: hypothetical protein D6739_05135 [Nitrospirae bacterium]|nr:MAG: hypothetical protein D6739_05135 [Nitrospirota bacterium]